MATATIRDGGPMDGVKASVIDEDALNNEVLLIPDGFDVDAVRWYPREDVEIHLSAAEQGVA